MKSCQKAMRGDSNRPVSVPNVKFERQHREESMRALAIASLVCSLVFGFALAGATPARADLALNAAGIADGFTLTEFLGGYPAVEYGPLAQGILPDGNVLTGSWLLNTSGTTSGPPTIMVFTDTDNQTLGSTVASAPYTVTTGNPNFAIATAGGQVYGAQLQGGVYEHFNADGTFTPIPNLQALGLRDNLGMWGDPVNGHLISASNLGLVDIDPVAGTFRVINASLFPDGVTVSADGTTAFIENGGEIQSVNIATGAIIQSYPTGHSPDGTGIISGGTFNGDVIVNNNDGTVGLLNPTSSAFTVIATGGTRGDFV